MKPPTIVPRARILFTSISVLALTLIPVTSDSQCCGGAAFSGGASQGLPNFGKIVSGKRLRLTVFPGNKTQIVEVTNSQTGAVVQTIPIPPSPGTPVGLTVPIPTGAALTATVKPDPANPGSGGDIDATVNSNVESASGDTTDQTEGDCPEKCEPPVDTGAPSLTQEVSESEDCEDDPGAGDPDNNFGAGSAGGGSGGGSGGSGGSGASGPANYYESLTSGIQQMQGGISIPMSLGAGMPKLTFSTADVTAAMSLPPTQWRQMLKSPLIGFADFATAETGGTRYSTRHGNVMVDPGTQLLRSMHLNSAVAVNIREGTNSLAVEFIDTRPLAGVTGQAVVLDSDGYYGATYFVQNGQEQTKITCPIYASWEFSTEVVNNTSWFKVRTNKAAEGRRSGEWKSWRYRQFLDANGYLSVTQMVDDQTGLTSDFLYHNDTTDLLYTRGQKFTTATGAVSGWMAVVYGNNGNVPAPQIYPGEEGLAKVHIGGSGNTGWAWSASGMFEKTTVAPSIHAPQRTITTLRPWGLTVNPTSALESNSHATITTITPLKKGFARTDVVKINNLETAWTARTKWGEPVGESLVVDETTQRYHNGFNSVPLVEYTQRHGRKAGDRKSGLPIKEQHANGTLVDYDHHEIPGGRVDDSSPSISSTRTETTLEGVVREQQTTLDYVGRVKESSSFIKLAGTLYAVGGTRHTYNAWDGKTDLTERLKVGPNTWYDAYKRVHSPTGTLLYTVHTDEAGIATTESTLVDPDNTPSVLDGVVTITRPGYEDEENGTIYVPAQTTRRTYDVDGNLTSERVVKVQGGTETTGKNSEWTYYPGGRIKSEQVYYGPNSPVQAARTVYVYEPVAGGGEKMKVYRQNAADPANLLSETTTDWSGKNVTVSGPAVIPETRVYEPITPSGGRRVRETVTRGSGQATIVSKREMDGLGRTIAEYIPGTANSMRVASFDDLGRLTQRSAGGSPVTSISYNGSTTTITTHASPDPNRVRNRVHEFALIGGALWEISRDEEHESRVQVTGFAAGVLSVRSSGRTGEPQRFTTVTATKTPGGLVTQTIARPGVADLAVSKSYDGLTFSTEAHSGDPGTTHEFDVLGRTVKTTDFSGRRVTVLQYDPDYGQLSTSTTTDQQTNVSSVSSNFYHAADTASRGRLYSSTTNGLTTNYAWTARGELQAQWGATYPVKYEYDDAGRLWKMRTYRVDPGNNPATWGAGDVTEWLYHSGTTLLQQKKDAAGVGPTYTYDTRGRLGVRTWARTVNGQPLTTTYNYNGADELRFINYSDATPDVTITRDNKGRVIGVTDGEGQRTYGRNEDGTIAHETLPGIGSGAVMEYGYDQYGRRRGYSVWNGADWVTWQGWGFDPATGRYSGINTPDGWIPFSYDSEKGLFTGWTVPGGTDPNLGQLQISVTRSYDGLGRITSAQSTNNWNLPGTSRAYGYDAQHRRNKLTDESGEWWQYDYNGRSEVTGAAKVHATAGGFDWVPGMYKGYNYDAIGNRASLTENDWGSGGTWVSNGLNQITTRVVGQTVAVIGSADPAGTVTAQATSPLYTEANGAVSVVRGSPPKSDRFAAYITTTQPATAKNLKVSVKETVGGVETQHDGHRVIVKSPELFAYDTDGNLTQDGRWNYVWDAENRLIGMETRGDVTFTGPDPLPLLRQRFKYDAFSRRVSKKVEKMNASSVYEQTSFRRFVYDGWDLIAEWGAEPVDFELQRTYHWALDLSGRKADAGGVGGLALLRDQQGSYAPAYDGNGNVIALLDREDGTRVAEYEYGPFGESLKATGSHAGVNSFRWSTRYCDMETGLLYYGFRYLDPARGRWLNRDTIRERGGINLYSVVRNSCIGRIDVLGMYEFQWDAWQTFAAADVAEIMRAFAAVRSRIDKLLPQLDEEITALARPDCPCNRAVAAELSRIKVILQKMAKGIDDPDKNLEIEWNDLGPNPDQYGGEDAYAAIQRSRIPGMDPVLILDEFGSTAWIKQSSEEHDKTIFHELTHLEGNTLDEGAKSPSNDAHMLEDLMVKDVRSQGWLKLARQLCRKDPNSKWPFPGYPEP